MIYFVQITWDCNFILYLFSPLAASSK
ncbi:unnamed protein product [Acanthoscelides obtectus]|uniref:Uncharacterized protein n=1 Tax=Acanthoscelides obtectus TaxID=200917 RepID=A0A9P0KXW3_ACAOB|nr:unnamed protein product [Acanthoscelides obtectus]CAK1635849.1 hypothetical protein AOBTE_LOCUS9559 [Acanthoscelides obtectus]